MVKEGSAAERGLDPCPLCQSTSGVPIQAVPYATIWRALERQFHATFTPEVLRENQPLPVATLYRCEHCGLDYFSPIAPGDPSFYTQLMASIPYEATRWDPEVVATLLEPDARIVDLGCGDGAFLRRIMPRAARAVGIDHNAEAIAKLRAAGLEGYTTEFAEFAKENAGAFDVAVSFHTLEHLRDAGDLVEPALRCLRPGGRLFLSVPNRDRDERGEFEPLDWPPHHVSRWAPEHFDWLAQRFGATLATVRFEQLVYGRRLQRVFARVGLPGLGSAASGVYTGLMLRRRGLAQQAARRQVSTQALRGLTMLAELYRPA